MLGAIIGDVSGSRFELGSNKTKYFTFLEEGCRLTDDSLMTIAVGCACVEADVTDENSFKACVTKYMREIGNLYPSAGYGENFYRWLISPHPTPYGSFGNGSAMRVSPVAYIAKTLDEAERLARWSAEVTHDHPDGIAGASAVAAAIFLAREGKSKEEIKRYVESNYYNLSFTLDGIRPTYDFEIQCSKSVPEAIVCFLEAKNFEDAVRNAISLGGDCDTQAAIAGSIAEAFFGIPDALQEQIFDYMDETIQDYYWSYADTLYEL